MSLSSVRDYARQKADYVREIRREHASVLGSLTELSESMQGPLPPLVARVTKQLSSSVFKLANKKNDQNHFATIEDVIKKLQLSTRVLIAIKNESHSPGLIARYWLILAAVSVSSAILYKAVKPKFNSWAAYVQQTVFGFINDWVVVPATDVLEIIQHREKRLSVIGKQSLISDTLVA